MARTAQVFIDGEVYSGSYCASIMGVRDMIEYQKPFDDIQVTINSYGGDIAEGLGIYDLLQSYRVPVSTVVIGQCCSAATIIFLAGSTRIIYESVIAFMVHKARGGPSQAATADELRDIADYIEKYDNRMTAIYLEKTGATEEQVIEWLSKDTYMTADEAFANGFATLVSKPVEAKAYYTRPAVATPAVIASSSESTPQNKIMASLKEKASLLLSSNLLKSVIALASGEAPKAKAHSLTDGSSIDIDEAGDTYSEQDEVTVGGEPAPDKTYELSDGTKITTSGGKISKIEKEDSADVTASGEDATTTETAPETVTASGETAPTTETDAATELATLRTENATLKAEAATREARLTTMESNMGKVEAKMKILLGNTESADVIVPVGEQKNKSVTAKATMTSAEQERATMLEERKNRGVRK